VIQISRVKLAEIISAMLIMSYQEGITTLMLAVALLTLLGVDTVFFFFWATLVTLLRHRCLLLKVRWLSVMKMVACVRTK
jgi:hypothetical protein